MLWATLSLTCDRSFPRLHWPPCDQQNAPLKTSFWSVEFMQINLLTSQIVLLIQAFVVGACVDDWFFWGEQDISGSWLQLRLVLFSGFRGNSHLFSGYLYCAQIKDFYYILITKITVAYSHDQTHRLFFFFLTKESWKINESVICLEITL